MKRQNQNVDTQMAFRLQEQMAEALDDFGKIVDSLSLHTDHAIMGDLAAVSEFTDEAAVDIDELEDALKVINRLVQRQHNVYNGSKRTSDEHKDFELAQKLTKAYDNFEAALSSFEDVAHDAMAKGFAPVSQWAATSMYLAIAELLDSPQFTALTRIFSDLDDELESQYETK